MRSALVLLHRWLGLGMALFLMMAGLTGALIAWDHELDAWLAPKFYKSSGATDQPVLTPFELARRVETSDPRLRVSYLPLHVAAGEATQIWVEPRLDAATGKPYELGFDQLAVDPSSGAVQARRLWGEPALRADHVMPFLYRLHYTLHLPERGGIPWGNWLMGAVALVWAIDAFIALWISFPNRRSWRKSLAFRWKQGGYKLNFDLHRSGGVWTWLLLLALAVSGVSLSLGNEIVRPVVSWFSPLSPSPFADREPNPALPEPSLEPAQALALARAEAARRGIEAPAGGLYRSASFGVYGVGFFEPGADHADGGLGNPWLYFDHATGALVGAELPGTGSAGDLFMQLQFPLHSGRLLGLPGRILVSLLGLVVAMLSVTGIVIWARKRRARLQVSAKASAPHPIGSPSSALARVETSS